MADYEVKLLEGMNDRMEYLMENEGYSAHDIACLIDDMIFDNDFSNECNQELWAIQNIYISLDKENLL